MKFTPYWGYVEVEPISTKSIIATEEKTFVEAAKVLSISQVTADISKINPGDIIFFRPHGFFETPEYEGKKHYVVRVDPEFVLGKISQ